jgi:hypothetical protein
LSVEGRRAAFLDLVYGRGTASAPRCEVRHAGAIDLGEDVVRQLRLEVDVLDADSGIGGVPRPGLQEYAEHAPSVR